MFVTMMKSKIHRATITESDLNYVGSITIDENIMKAVNILENEKVQIVNNHNGARFETYVIKGEAGSGQICVNGAAARLVQPGDTIIIIAYAMMEALEAKEFKPQVAIMNAENQIDQLLGTEPAYTVL
ncbi:aspartate 1-decarboxylase [Alkalicoccobacillus plakortidis]|uniref:Aspartate 1-decarboxylase n=1 Tax=Alkalicoccobacillus plakortidis TaxID=444060 RepID=A0ABT0XEN7_9BACI|nr:aspartate 1-decarboxylase [Alkalicoccobacillus plakortidis]MCM2674360.1 aspartate 1-decarboxylase [Alkalicoccobacillus plakortidis]